MYIQLFFNLFLGSSVFFIFLTSNWLLLWVWLECVTLSLVILLQRLNSGPRNVEAVSKYFVLQAVAGVIILFGVLLRWGGSGVLFVWGDYSFLCYGLILFGLLVKLAVFPNPFWFVDVVSGLSLGRSVYVVVVSKLGPLYLYFTLSEGAQSIGLLLIGLFSAFLGSALGTNQFSVRKIVALSSIANLGWFIVCLPFLGGHLGVICFVGYIVSILVLLWVTSFYCYDYLLKGGHVYYNSSGIILLIVSLLSLGGLPPFVGFFVKWQLFQGLVSANLFWVCGVLIASSLLSLYFYLNISFSCWSLNWVDSRSSVLYYHVVGSVKAVLWVCLLVFFGLIGGFFIGPVDSLLG
uniref:NADH dehydrogenase subunit 2 n=1 Tax=Ophiactis savignyi TaxID=154024 RepID=UPI002115A8D6|nr:NADH dehydrogenase subunit 2 [Ophiactis savignyi]USQ67433.1 NADH dehydrogenase subunit 2 [Ophiactis savignyi]